VFELFCRFKHMPAVGHYMEHSSGFEKSLRGDIKRAFMKPVEPRRSQPPGEIYRPFHEDQQVVTGPPRRRIELTGDYLSSAVDEAEAAVIEQRAGLFQRGDFIVRPGAAQIAIRGGAAANGERLYEVHTAELREHFSKCAEFVRWDIRNEQWKPTNCPEDVARAYAERRGRWKLPALVGILNAPTLRADGSILAQPGYDDATGLIFAPAPGVEFPPVPMRPSRADALVALDLLKSLIATFPFETAADRSVALSSILTAVVRRTLKTAPMHCFSSPRRGTGKGKLVDIAAGIGTGREASTVVQGRNEEETEKRLVALILSGDPVVSIDNCTLPIEGDFLCSLMTQEHVRVRILGKSEAPRLPSNVAMFATGNNLSIRGDMTRRVLRCSIDAQLEFPEQRAFDRDPVEEAKRNRGLYHSAALTILRAFKVAGSPSQSVPLGSFEQWNSTVRDPLLWLGEADPCETQTLVDETDTEREQLAVLLDSWAGAIGPTSVSIKQAIDIASSRDEKSCELRPEGERLLDAFRAVASLPERGGGQGINTRVLGRYLAKNEKVVVEGKRFVRAGLRSDVLKWRVETLGSGEAATGNAQ
jgi:hypothetical protein